MPLTKLQFRPGINREITSYSNEGGWFDCDKIRFRYGFPEKIGGWLRLSATTFLGTCRALHPWVALDGSRYLGVGTHLKYYINEGGGYADITPLRDTTTAGDVTFAAAATTLSAGITAIQTTIPLTSSTGFPPSGLIQIGSEQMRYATVTGNDLEGVTRGVNGTIPASHLSGADVDCATLTVSDTAHGALDNDFVTFSGAASLGSQITAAILNQEYQIVSIVDVDSYLIEARAVATIAEITTSGGLDPTPVFADSSDSGDGGAAVVGAYQINTGLDTTIIGNGWGAGTWGRGTWGSGADISTAGEQLRIWSHDNFGEDLLFNVRNGGIPGCGAVVFGGRGHDADDCQAGYGVGSGPAHLGVWLRSGKRHWHARPAADSVFQSGELDGLGGDRDEHCGRSATWLWLRDRNGC